MRLELELAVILVLTIIGSSVFAVFELETLGRRKVLKWLILSGLTLGIYRLVGHSALILPLGGALAGSAFHLWWCRRHGIHPLRATPRRKYYQLRGWSWPDGGER